ATGHTQPLLLERPRVLLAAYEHRDVRDLCQMPGEEAADHARAGDADPLDQAAPWTSATNSSSSTSPRLAMPVALTRSSRSANCSSGTPSPSSSTLIRIESSPLFLPSTTERCAATSSEEYGSIDGGSWNWLATAPLSRR